MVHDSGFFDTDGTGRSQVGLGLPFHAGGFGNSSPDKNSFSVTGNGANFGPFFMPDRISVSKKRNLVRHANFCGLEDVFEVHGENREIHVNGRIRESEYPAFRRLLNHRQPADLITPSWSGEVRVLKGDHEGPIGWEPQSKQHLYKYSLDLVSTGEDEAGHLKNYNHGILDDGSNGDVEDSGVRQIGDTEYTPLSE